VAPLVCFDSVTAADIPAGAGRVAGYVDGLYRWSTNDWLRFPGARITRIAVNPATDAGNAGDVEQGDMTPQTAAAWAARRLTAGEPRVLVYCNRSTRAAVESALRSMLPDPELARVGLWIATLDGTQMVPAGPLPVVMVQYAGANMSGGHYDLSLVYDATWPGPAGPVPPPAPSPVKHQCVIVVSALRVRLAPHVTAPIFGTYPRGDFLDWIGSVKGDRIGAVDDWYIDHAGRYFWAGGVHTTGVILP
jgi:hypothetical protein